MSFDDLQTMVGTALVDRSFCEQLLTSPELVAKDFDLSDVERQVVLSIRADSLEEFAAKLEMWMPSSSGQRKQTPFQPERHPQAFPLAG